MNLRERLDKINGLSYWLFVLCILSTVSFYHGRVGHPAVHTPHLYALFVGFPMLIVVLFVRLKVVGNFLFIRPNRADVEIFGPVAVFALAQACTMFSFGRTISYIAIGLLFLNILARFSFPRAFRS